MDATTSPLQQIIDAATASGWHICNWSELRASSFPGPSGWAALKAWCAEHDLDCAICFSQASRAAEVQFRKRHFRKPREVAVDAPPAEAPPPDEARQRPPRSVARPVAPPVAVEPPPAAPKTTIVGIPWYEPAQYERLRSLMADGDELPSAYDLWASSAAELADTLQRQGVEAVRVAIDPDSFVAWCKTIRIRPDARARQGFANEKAFSSHLEQD